MVSPRQRQAHALMSAEGLGERLLDEGGAPHKSHWRAGVGAGRLARSAKRPELLRPAAGRFGAGCTVSFASASSELLRRAALRCRGHRDVLRPRLDLSP